VPVSRLTGRRSRRTAGRRGRARSIAVRCSECIRPDPLTAELSQPLLGGDLGAIVRLLAIIPPPAHCYLRPITRSLPALRTAYPARGQAPAYRPRVACTPRHRNPAFALSGLDAELWPGILALRPQQAFGTLKWRKRQCATSLRRPRSPPAGTSPAAAQQAAATPVPAAATLATAARLTAGRLASQTAAAGRPASASSIALSVNCRSRNSPDM
jgi:hypothetical protein